MSTAKDFVQITEVGPRDGLQNEKVVVPTDAKVAFVDGLSRAGLKQIEVTSFVHPKRVPAMADAADVFQAITRLPDTRYLALTPNNRGYDRAVAAGCNAVAVFTGASESFTRANIGMSIAESITRFTEIASRAKADGVVVRGYVSTVFACPFEGPTRPEKTLELAQRMLEIGCYEVSLGDTVGVGTPAETRRLLDVILPHIPADRLVLHLHDTWGMAAANVSAGLEYGIRHFDASAGGLGGCPYAPGASGNLATEDLLYLLESLGYETGVSLNAVVDASDEMAPFLNHALPSRVHQAVIARRQAERS